MAINESVITRELYCLAIQELHPSSSVASDDLSDQKIHTLIAEIQDHDDVAMDA